MAKGTVKPAKKRSGGQAQQDGPAEGPQLLRDLKSHGRSAEQAAEKAALVSGAVLIGHGVDAAVHKQLPALQRYKSAEFGDAGDFPL